MKINIQKLTETAILPSQATKGDAGYDLYSVTNDYIFGGQRFLFKTGLSVEIPIGFYGRIADRSGLALKKGIHVLGGVIDSSYRGEIGIILINLNNDGEKTESFRVNIGDRIAQLIIEKCHEVEWNEVPYLSKSDRGIGGFGSTG